jgi:hypothetical protein
MKDLERLLDAQQSKELKVTNIFAIHLMILLIHRLNFSIRILKTGNLSGSF